MGIFLGLSDPQLGLPGRSQHFPYGICRIFLRIDDMEPLECCIIRGHGTIVKRHGLHPELRHILLGQDYRQLLGPVVPEVEIDHDITFLQLTDCFSLFIHNHDGLHEFIGHFLVVRLLHGIDNTFSGFTYPVHNKVVALLDPLPSFVPVH